MKFKPGGEIKQIIAGFGSRYVNIKKYNKRFFKPGFLKWDGERGVR
jgi:hypothetical protein